MDTAKDLESIRKVVEDVAGQINVLLLSRTVIMVGFTILLIRAMVLWNAGPVQSKIDEISSLSSSFPKGTSIPRVDPLSLLTAPSSLTETTTDPKLMDSAKQIDADALALHDEYWSTFGVEFSLLGTKLQVDLRIVILLLPVFGPLANIYLTSLREKRRHLIAIGRAKLEDATEAATMDSIVFRGHKVPWIFDQPASILNLAFWASVLTLAGLCLVFESYQGRAEDRQPGIIFLDLTAAAFLAALHWGRNIETRIRREVREQTGISVPPGPAYARVERARQFVLGLASRIFARRAILAGGVLMLVTLALDIGQTGCDNDPHKGIDVVRLKADYAADFGLPADDTPSFGDAAYILMLVFAVAAIVAAITGRPRWMPNALCAVAPFVMMLVLALDASTFLLITTFGWLIYWVLVSLRYAWLLGQLRRGKRTVSECESTVLSCSEPMILPAIFCLVPSFLKYAGLPVMTFGVMLLTAGAYAWARRTWESYPTIERELEVKPVGATLLR